MTDKNNEPAFPCATGSDGGIMFAGMSLRAYFAGQSLVGIRTRNPVQIDYRHKNSTKLLTSEDVANMAINDADALIAKLNEGEK